MRIVVYERVSGDRQTTENQARDLDAWLSSRDAHAAPFLVARISEEATTRNRRPKHDDALALLRSGEADTLLFWSLDRWGRSMSELMLEMDEAVRKGWRIISLKEDIDLGTAAGRLYVDVLAAFANFERSRISERTKAGLARARASGKRLGRPRKYPVAA